MLIRNPADGVVKNLESETGDTQSTHRVYGGSTGSSTVVPSFRGVSLNDIPGSTVGNAAVLSNYFAAFAAVQTATVGSWGCAPSFTGTGAAVAATSALPNALNAKTATASGSSAGLTFTTSLAFGTTKAVRFTIRLAQTTSMRIWIGLGSSNVVANYATDTPNLTFIGFRYSTAASDAKYQCTTQTSNVAITRNAETTASHVDTSIHYFDIQYDGTNAIFFIDGVQVGSQSGNLALGTNLFPLVLIDNVATLNNQPTFDFYKLVGQVISGSYQAFNSSTGQFIHFTT